METLTWTNKIYKEGDDKPENRVGAAMYFYNESLYMWGLSDGNKENSENVFVYRYDLSEERWYIVCKNKENISARNYHTIAIYNDYFYVIYGVYLREGFEPTVIKRINLLSCDEWKEANFGATDLKLFMFGAVHDGTNVYAVCGSTQAEQFNSVIRLDIKNHQIEYESKNYYTFKRRHSYSLFRVENQLLLFGGADEEKS